MRKIAQNLKENNVKGQMAHQKKKTSGKLRKMANFKP
jgi:hypothetical protein